jgi:hypothetical protein
MSGLLHRFAVRNDGQSRTKQTGVMDNEMVSPFYY